MRNFYIAIFTIFCLFVGGAISPIAAQSSDGDQLIVLNKKNNRLAFYEDGKLVRTFSVATGIEETFTPEGTFKIVNKIKNRPYYAENIPGGDPTNPLGDRWLGLDARGTWGTTYAIHGNANPSSIGRYVSQGCVRMRNDEVRWLFDRVKLYTPVVITHSKLSFDELAAAHWLQSNPIEEVDTTISLMNEAKLFDRPYGFGYTGQTLAPQKVNAFEKTGDWYRINTWFGDAWLRANDAIVGPRVDQVDTVITLLSDAKLYAHPNGKGWTGHTIAPQRVTAFEKTGDWYRIKTWFGDAWLSAEDAIVGEPKIESVYKTLTLTNNTKLYANPYGIGDTGHTLAPQPVTAFEQTGDWYRINTWFGDAWLRANNDDDSLEAETFHFAANEPVTDPAPSEVLKEPEIVGRNELDRQQVSIEVMTPDQLDASAQAWYDALIATNEPTATVWNGERYIFLPDGYLQEVIIENGKLIVTGTAPESSHIAPLPLLIKLPGIAMDQPIVFK